MRSKILILGLICLFFISCASIIDDPRRQKYIKAHPELSSQIKNAIFNGDILIGMTPEQVVASRGRPYDINRTTGSWGVHEQWVMLYENTAAFDDPKAYEYAYIYFENGKVTSWQSK